MISMFFLYFCGVTIIAIIYALFDVNYFLRLSFLYTWVKLFNNKKKLLDTTTIYGICTTQDVDLVFTHMNNARYLRELDFGRFYYYNKTGLYRNIINRGGAAFQTASIVRYRRSILMFTPYKIITKLIYWEDKHFYMEHQFINLMDNFVYAIILTRQTLIKLNLSIQDIFAEIEPGIEKPISTKELTFWLEAIKESSRNLRK